jgi:hypothetical protein
LGNGCHINGIESFWSFTKRRLRRFNGMAKHMFALHLKECEWRWEKPNDLLFEELLKLFKMFRAEALNISNSSNSYDDDELLTFVKS